MAQGVAEVEELALAALKFVLVDHGGLDLHVPAHHAVNAAVDILGHEKVVEVPVRDQAVLHRLGYAVGEGVLRQGFKCVCVADNHRGLVEGPRQIFPRGQVDGGLAAHGGVRRGQEGGGHLDVVDSPLVGGGGEARHVAHNAAAQSNHEVGAGQLIFRQEFQHTAIGLQILALLPGGEGVEAYLEPRFLEGAAHNGGVELFHRGIGDNGAGPGLGHSRDQLPGPFQKAGSDVDGIGRGRIDSNGLHKNHSLVRISRLWLVAPMRSGRSQMERWYLT